MSEGVSETTVREESAADVPAGRLALEWVWPRPRVELLQGARLSIGRDETASLRLDGTGVSRNHAELYRQGPLYVLRDLGSTNGTWLGGRRIEHAREESSAEGASRRGEDAATRGASPRHGSTPFID